MHIRPNSWRRSVLLSCSDLPAIHLFLYWALGNFCRGACVKQPKKQKFSSLEKANTEYGLCSLERDWYVNCHFTNNNATTQAIWHAGGRSLREKALYRLEIESAVYTKLFWPPVARLLRLASVKGFLNRNNLWVSVWSRTPKESMRWPIFWVTCDKIKRNS